MDARNVIAFRSYPETPPDRLILAVDEQAREALGVPYGHEITVQGRRECRAEIQPLPPLDQDGRMARVSPALREALMIEYGEDLLLSE